MAIHEVEFLARGPLGEKTFKPDDNFFKYTIGASRYGGKFGNFPTTKASAYGNHKRLTNQKKKSPLLYIAWFPPSTMIVSPVTKAEASEARNTATPLRSLPVPNLLSGVFPAI